MRSVVAVIATYIYIYSGLNVKFIKIMLNYLYKTEEKKINKQKLQGTYSLNHLNEKDEMIYVCIFTADEHIYEYC